MSSSMAAAMASKSIDMVNHEILRVLHQPPKADEELPDILKFAAEALKNKFYNGAAKYFKKALESKSKDRTLNKMDERSIVLIKYMLCACWLESTDAKDLLEALQMLEELEREHKILYPMVYYAIGKANFKLYRFTKADELWKTGESLLANREVKFVPYCIPGSDVVIAESVREGFMAALENLKKQCSDWRRPNAVCCWAECSNTGHNEGVDKNIFFGCPTFIGMIRVTCNHPSNPCVMSFHVACWKAKRESLDLPKKISPKELGHVNCFTPNCMDAKGERSMLKKIEFFNEQACVKSMIEARADDALKHTKVLPTSKGALKKQQQPKSKVLNENRPPLARIPRPPVPKEVPKVDGTEEEDDLTDEQALTAAIDKLNELRGNNFGLDDDKIWRPDLSMYGSEYMIATADLLPDPNFSNDTSDDEEKSFIFSYMFALISNNGPMKIDRLEEKWKEAQKDVIGKDCEYLLERHVDIAEFLTQSLKFATIGDYICTADKLPEAYALAKNDVSEILKFCMDNDVDQQSTTSSLDDEAVFNDIINHEKNTGALLYPTILDGAKILNKEPDGNSEITSVPIKEAQNKFTNGFVEAKNIPELEKWSEALGCLDQESVGNVRPLEISEIKPNPTEDIASEKKPVTSEPSLKGGKSDSPAKTNMHKRSYTPEIPTSTTTVTSMNTGIKVQKTSPMEYIYRSEDAALPKNAIKGACSVGNIEYELKSRQSTLKLDKLARETKSTNDLKNQTSLLDDTREISMDNVVNADKRLQAKKPPTAALTTKNTEASNSATPKSNVLSGCKDNPKLIAEMEELREKLAQSKKETEALKLEIEQLKEKNATSRGQLLRRILNGQYDYNKSIITAKLNEWRNNYKMVLDVQKTVNVYTGQTLRINESDMLRMVATVEDMAANLEAQFTTLLEQLLASVENGNPREVDLPLVKVPKLPNCDVAELLKSAFDVYRMHQQKELQKLKQAQAQQQRLFMSSQYGRIPYHGPNMQNNNLGLHGPMPQPNLMYMSGVQSTGPLHHTGLPLLQSSMIPQPLLYGQQQSMQHAPNMQMQSIYGRPNAAQNNPLNAHDASNLSKADNSNLPFAQTMQTNLLNSDRLTGQSFDRAQTDLSQQTNFKSGSEQNLKHGLQQLERLSMKIAAGQSVGTLLPTTSGVPGSAAENSIADCNPQTSNSLVTPDISQSKINTQPIEKAAATDSETTQDFGHENTTSVPTEKRPCKTPGRSLDRLMQRLRSRYTGVLELDLLKSVECVRKQRKSLSQVPMIQIIRDVDKYIEAFQQRQLCGYVKPQPNPTVASRSTTPGRVSPGSERSHPNAAWPSSPMPSARRELPATMRSKKQWEPVGIPNDTWTNTGESECIICLETMEKTESYTLQCKHSFHRKCIQDWYKHRTSSEWVMGSCPLCRHHSTIDIEYPPLG